MNVHAIPAIKPVNVELDAAREFEPGKLTFRTQTPSDGGKLEQLCPRDQQKVFVGRWVDSVTFVIEQAPEGTPAVQGEVTPDQAELARVNALGEDELKTLAAERGVKWDKKASRETMVKLIADAADPTNAQ